MPRKGANYCPKCGEYGTTVAPFQAGASAVVVNCNHCPHTWKSRSKHELKWARIKAQEIARGNDECAATCKGE